MFFKLERVSILSSQSSEKEYLTTQRVRIKSNGALWVIRTAEDWDYSSIFAPGNENQNRTETRKFGKVLKIRLCDLFRLPKYS